MIQLELFSDALISIDPDTKHYGWALFGDKVLQACGIGKIDDSWRPGAPGAHWVCEVPEQRGKGSPVKVSTLIQLALCAGRVVGDRKCDFVTPNRWKGNLKKETHHKRMFEVLSGFEHDRLSDGVRRCNKDTILDVNDAVALGLWRQGRL